MKYLLLIIFGTLLSIGCNNPASSDEDPDNIFEADKSIDINEAITYEDTSLGFVYKRKLY